MDNTEYCNVSDQSIIVFVKVLNSLRGGMTAQWEDQEDGLQTQG